MTAPSTDDQAAYDRMISYKGPVEGLEPDLFKALRFIVNDRDALRKAAEGMAEALQKALNYLENTEGEFGITLISGDACRAALAAYEELKP